MAMNKWHKHYTGISIYEFGPVYLQRDTRTEKLQFARFSFAWRIWARVYLRATCGLFLGFTNHLNRARGCEVFGEKWHAGYTSEPVRTGMHYSGSSREPWATATLACGRLFIGRRSPKWLVRAKGRAAEKYWAGMGNFEDEGV